MLNNKTPQNPVSSHSLDGNHLHSANIFAHLCYLSIVSVSYGTKSHSGHAPVMSHLVPKWMTGLS